MGEPRKARDARNAVGVFHIQIPETRAANPTVREVEKHHKDTEIEVCTLNVG